MSASRLRITLHRGFHEPGLLARVRETWERDELLIFCPPTTQPGAMDFAFVDLLPEGEIVLSGDWGEMGALPSSPLASNRPATSHCAKYPDRPVLGVFTSGTSGGAPKLVLYSKRNITASLDGILSFFDPAKISTIFCYPQPSHTFGLLLGYALSALRGYRLIAAEGKYGAHFHARRSEVTDEGCITLGTPTHFRDLIGYVEARGLRLVPSYSAIIGGARCQVELWREVRDRLNIAAPSIGYGATEASPGIAHLPPGVEPSEEGEIGFPLPHLDVRLEPEGIHFAGASLCLATIQGGQLVFPQQGWLTDRISRRNDGVMVFHGRAEGALNRGGEKFWLEEMERVLHTECGGEALCVSLPDERLGEELGILWRGEEPESKVTERIFPVLQARFGRKFNPGNLAVVAALPLTASAKPDRARAAALLEGLLEGRFPVPVSRLQSLVPHRPPMVWISDVLRAGHTEGECRIKVRAGAPYLSDGRMRESSFIELMAQGYAFVQACHRWREARAGRLPARELTRAYLAGLRNIELTAAAETQPAEGDWRVEVKLTRELGPIALVDAWVRNEQGELLAKGNLKLFAE